MRYTDETKQLALARAIAGARKFDREDVQALLDKLTLYRNGRATEWGNVHKLLSDLALGEREIRMAFASLAMCVHELHGGSHGV
jgi:hypothetical protein